MLRYISLLSLALILLLAAPAPVVAQSDCDAFVLLQDNTSYELLNFDKKDRQTGRVAYKVKNVNRNGGQVEATIHSQVYDQKDKLTTEGEFTMGCDGGNTWVDMRSLVNSQMMEAYQNMEMSMQGDKMIYPTNLQVGQQLEDGTITMEFKDKSSGQVMSTMVLSIVDRKVEGKENVSVPAGSYDSYKISQSTEMENRAMGIKMPGMRIQTVEYYVPKLGMVRSETYRNGKLLSYTVLNKVSQ